MKSILLPLVPLLLAIRCAEAGTADGNGALALAGLVARVSPEIGGLKQGTLAKLIDGRSNFTFPAGQTIVITAQSVRCRASTVDIKSHSCELKFATHLAMLKGRPAHELFATILEIGVPPDGAAGSTFAAVSNLHCLVDPNEVKHSTGGGANCRYDPF